MSGTPGRSGLQPAQHGRCLVDELGMPRGMVLPFAAGRDSLDWCSSGRCVLVGGQQTEGDVVQRYLTATAIDSGPARLHMLPAAPVAPSQSRTSCRDGDPCAMSVWCCNMRTRHAQRCLVAVRTLLPSYSASHMSADRSKLQQHRDTYLKPGLVFCFHTPGSQMKQHSDGVPAYTVIYVWDKTL
jgi:hypothetical protein